MTNCIWGVKERESRKKSQFGGEIVFGFGHDRVELMVGHTCGSFQQGWREIQTKAINESHLFRKWSLKL